MKLKIIVILLIAFFSLALCAPVRVDASGLEITTTADETLTTAPVTTQDAIQAAIDAQLAKAQNLIMSGVVSLGGASAVGGVVSVFLAKRRKQIEAQIAVAKDANVKAKAAYDSGKEILVSKFDSFQADTKKFQDTMLAKYEAMTAKANEQVVRASAIIETYQKREEALQAFVKAEADEAIKAAEAAKNAAIVTATTAVNATVATVTDTVQKASV